MIHNIMGMHVDRPCHLVDLAVTLLH